jgi:putative PIN family toxin of toxin-antitoxin system
VKRRVVLDTNVVVSGLLGGTATDVIRRWRAGSFDLILSEEIMTEYADVLNRPKFNLPLLVVEELLGYIRARAEWVEPRGEIETVARDPSDDKFLEAAVTGQADWLVSGDYDLLGMEEYEGIAIIPPHEFLDLL